MVVNSFCHLKISFVYVITLPVLFRDKWNQLPKCSIRENQLVAVGLIKVEIFGSVPHPEVHPLFLGIFGILQLEILPTPLHQFD